MFTGIANAATNRPWRMIVAVIAVTVLAATLSAGLTDRLSTRGFQNYSSESAQATDRIVGATGADPEGSVVALVTPRQNPTGTAGRQRVTAVAAVMAADPDMGAVVTPFTGGRINPALVARDGESVLVAGQLKPGRTEGDAAERLEEVFAGNADVLLGGSLVAQHNVSMTVEDDLRRAEMIAFPLLFLLSLFVFRGLIAAGLPLLVGGLTIPIAFMVIGGVDQITDLSVFALNLTTGLGLGLAIDYSLLLTTRFREELESGAETRAAVRTTVATAGRTIVFSAITVAGSLAALAIFPLKFLYSMAVAGASVALVAAIVSLALIPAILMLLGPRINSLSLSRKSLSHSTARWRSLGRGVLRRPVLVAGVTTAVLLLGGLPAISLKFTSVDATVLPSSSSPYQVEMAMQQRFAHSDSTANINVIVDAGKRDRAEVARLAKRVDKLDEVRTVAEPRYLGDDTWQIDAFPHGSRYSTTALEAVEGVRAIAIQTNRADDVLVGGNSSFFYDQRETIMERIPLAIVLVGGITFIVLFLMTGSVVLPLMTFIMNLLTLSATFGLLALIFQNGHLEGLLDYTSQGALEMTQPVLLFCVAFGLATDYGVFLLSRIKELHDAGLENEEAVVEGLARTGRVITAAALLFCVAIGAFATSQIIFIKELGVGTAIAVAIDATIVRALLVTSLMGLMGRWNWWAPKPLARLYERIGVSEGPSAPPGAQGPTLA